MKATEEVFLKDVANHKMTVLLDNGIYRHLRFAKEGARSWNQWFDIVTWPGFLAYSGDMGCFVFSRLKDMFEFFRGRPYADEKQQLYINLSYWAEKLEAVDRSCSNPGEQQYSPEIFAKRVNETVSEWIEEYGLSEEHRADLREAIKDDVLRYGDDGEYEAHRALRDFETRVGGILFHFSDTWEWDLRDYTFRFVWCCYAIAWAIQQYDAVTEKAASQ